MEKLPNVDFSRLEDGDMLWGQSNRVRSEVDRFNHFLNFTSGRLLRRRHRQVVAVWVGSGTGTPSAAVLQPR